MDSCKGPTSQFPFRLKCLSGLKRLAVLVFYSQDIVDDYFPAQPTAKISSALYEYKGGTDTTAGGEVLHVKMAEMFVAE